MALVCARQRNSNKEVNPKWLSKSPQQKPPTPNTETFDKIVIRFAGDSGDGMQVAGSRFTDASALFGNDLATLPSFPAEIRAPAGTLPGVSSFQVQIADFDILTAGDQPDCLVAMNPAALKKELKDLRQGGTLVVNSDAFDERNLAKAGYQTNPLDDGTLDGFRVISVPMDELTKEAVKDSGVSGRSVLRSKNFLRPRPPGLAVPSPDRANSRMGSEEVRQDAGSGERQHRGVPGRIHPWRGDRSRQDHLRHQARCSRARDLHQHQRQLGPGLGSDRSLQAVRAAAVLRVVSDHPGLRHPPRVVAPQELRGADLPGGGRDRRRRIGHRCGVRRAPWRSPGPSGPGIALKSESISPGLHDGAAADRHQRPAGWALDRAPHQAGAVGPAVLALRPSWRVPDPGDRSGVTQ